MSLYSPYWYRVAEIRPRLRSHVRLHRHVYRGQDWYVLLDPSSSRQHRFSRTAYRIIGLMDGERTVRAIWTEAATLLGDDTPTQDEMIRLISQLYRADVLQTDIPPDSLELFERQDQHRAKWLQRLVNPLALRFPLVDPDRFLVKSMVLVKPLFSWAAALLWLLVVGSAFVLAVQYWPELTHNLADRVLTRENLLLLWLVYPCIKLLHELGHAYATRIWGGEVHEMGIMLLALMPIPYVEASASAVFPDKRRRMAVAAAGMAVEVFVAALALFLWLGVEPGRVSSIAYNVILIGGVSTLLFNGNPLLRFDGYFLLMDWLEIPNLAQRSNRYLGYLLQRYLFGISEVQSPVTAPGERFWLFGYGIGSFFYRLLVLTVLIVFISSKFFFIGVLIALWASCSQVLAPVVRNSYRFFSSIAGRRRRTRCIAVSLLIAVTAVLLLFVAPAPLRTRAEGVVSLPQHSLVRAGTDCFVRQVLVEDSATVQSRDPLIRCEDPFLEAEVRVLEAMLRESQARYEAEPLQSRVQREIIKKERAAIKADLVRARERQGELTIHSPTQGVLVLPDGGDLPGRFVQQGDLLGYIIGDGESTVTLVVSQADIALVRQQTRRVELRRAGHPEMLFATSIDREVPAAEGYLPSPVLAIAGGGRIPTDPADPQGVQTLKKTFQFEVRLPLDQEDVFVGERVYAMFDHGYEPLALQWYRSFRQLFLRRFHV